MTYFIINDNAAGQLAVRIQPDRSGGAKTGVLTDRVVPANSPENSAGQKTLREWAVKNQVPFAYGRVMTGALLAGDQSADFGWKITAGDLVVSTVPEVYAAGGCGAFGLCLEPEEFAAALEQGEVPEQKNPAAPGVMFWKLAVEGSLPEGCMASDAAWESVKCLEAEKEREDGSGESGKNDKSGKRGIVGDGIGNIVLLCGGPAIKSFSLEERAVFCQILSRLGVLSVAVMPGKSENNGDAETEALSRIQKAWESASPAVCLDLKTVCPQLPQKDGRSASVYIGGMGGFLSDIRLAAELLSGKHIAQGVRLLVSPASAGIYCEAADAGYLTAIMDAGGVILNQCAGADVQGRIGDGEWMVSNDCHDESGYAGPDSARIILVSTRTAVTCALTGRLGKEVR